LRPPSGGAFADRTPTPPHIHPASHPVSLRPTEPSRIQSSDPTSSQPANISAALWAAAALAIGFALQVSYGIQDARGLRWLTAGIILAWVGVFIRGGKPWLPWFVCIAGLVWQFHQQVVAEPLGDHAKPQSFDLLGVPLMAVLAVLAIWEAKRLRGRKGNAEDPHPNPLPEYRERGKAPTPTLPLSTRGGRIKGWRFRPLLVLMLLTYFIVGALLIHASPNPFIDVFEVTKDSCQAFAHGLNPYAIDFPNIYAYTHGWDRAFYPPGFVYDGRVHFGYQYMPLSFFVSFAGYLFTHDFRLGNLAAVTIAGGLLALSGDGLATAAAAILLFTPRVYYVLERGWSEPAVVLCLAFVIYCARRRPRWLPWAVGLLLVSKQHMILIAPALPLLLPRPLQWRSSLQFLFKAAIVGAAITLPLVLWNVPAFWKSAITVQVQNPFRADSLNYAATWVRAGHAAPGVWLSLVFAAIAGAIVFWKAPRTPAGFAIGVSLIFLCFFSVAKQAFCNYYFLTVGALCCAVAAADIQSVRRLANAPGSDSRNTPT